MVNDDVFTKVGLTEIEMVTNNVFTKAGRGLTCLTDTSAASLAFSVRIHLHRPLMSSTGGITSRGIGGSR